IVADLARMHSGLLVISGTHGSGKTTTAASIIEQINQTQKRRIISLEKPVEYSFVSKQSIIEQRQIGQDTPSFKDGIRMCLEEDVDVVYVGEMHEGLEEVVPLLIESASGNSLVIVEVNAPNTIKAVDTLLNGVLASYKNEEAARHSLADVLAAVVAQRLLPRRGGGLIPAIEVMLGNTSVKSLIRENKIYQLESIIQTSKKDGMISMDKAIEDLVHLGEVKGEDVGIARA
ncbi:Flp pilus assembly complex ATPase component TadA, partial [Candidatus Falkowbacteria bacterium]|nr:Flp pilus assembly complex ATPase component TadA [Candidatus Falkowbacteria bacterium]